MSRPTPINPIGAPVITWARPLMYSADVAAVVEAAGYIVSPRAAHCGNDADAQFVVVQDGRGITRVLSVRMHDIGRSGDLRLVTGKARKLLLAALDNFCVCRAARAIGGVA